MITGDWVRLQQVVLNLIVNALQAMSPTGEGARERTAARHDRIAETMGPVRDGSRLSCSMMRASGCAM
jgi:C4-dicarboxylate-specific signal transduction histidine kinase